MAKFAPFVITHGKTDAQKKSGELYDQVTKTAKNAPAKGGRKLLVLFHAKNPNGLIARFDALIEDRPEEGSVFDAIAYIQRFGKIAAWPSAPVLEKHLKVFQAAVEANEKAAAEAQEAEPEAQSA